MNDSNQAVTDPAPGVEMQALRQLLDGLPIYATRIGYRYDSTAEERAFGERVFELSKRWDELKREGVDPE
jgi:hypothetical protein